MLYTKKNFNLVMNIRKIGLWGFFCVFSIFTNAQLVIKQTKTVNWKEPVTINFKGEERVLLQFSDMGDLSPEINTPNISESFKLPYGTKPENLEVLIEDIEYIWPTPKEHSLFSKEINNNSIKYSYNTSKNGQQYFVDVSLFPVIKPEGAPSFKKIKKYTLKISYLDKKDIASSLKKASKNFDYVNNSVLNTGKWVKVSVENSGIHKITYSTLQDWGFSNPQNIGVYGNGGRMIPADNDEFRNDDLVENAIWHNNNAIYFYAEGPIVWDYNTSNRIFTHEKNDFCDLSYYFLTEKNTTSRNLMDSQLQPEEFETEVNYFNDYAYHEEDNLNLIRSGSVWYGERFDYYSNASYNFNFSFPNAIVGANARSYARLAARSSSLTKFNLFVSDKLIGSSKIYGVTLSSHTSYHAREGVINESFVNNSNSNINVRLDYDISETESSSIGYLDYLCINVDRKLIFEENELAFRNINVVSQFNSVKYSIQSQKDIIIWDITNPLIPLKVNTSNSGLANSFNYNTNELRQFIAFDPLGSFPSPKFVENVVNQNLHASPFVDYIIVCHPDFITQAERLGQIHYEYNDMTYLVVTTEQIYNEFSSGKPDVTAIRCFAKMLYDKANSDSEKPKNLLLFGDGSYDNRQGIADNTNKIPTYQSKNSLHHTQSFVSDDYFGLLDDGEGDYIKGDKVDIGIGRFPVNTIEEATNAVDKTYNYLYNQSNDLWKSNLTFIGDDGDNNVHMIQSNDLTINIENKYPGYNLNKFFFDYYEKVSTTTGQSIPGIENDISDALEKGTLLMNYTGHGGTSTLAHERIITKEHIARWNNNDKLTLFVTATCEFSRFDEKEHTSAGEEIFLNPHGGGIGLYTTTRIVYSNENKKLNDSFYKYVFERDETEQPYTLGQIMQHTKNNLAVSSNKLNFTLLGDPAIRLIYPKSKVHTTQINNTDIFEIIDELEILNPIDSLKALSKVKISGQITDGSNKLKSDFNGEVYILVYDKQTSITTRGNNGAKPFTFETFDNIIFKGLASVKNGEFETEFIMPKDIRYNFDKGKISYYAFSDDDNSEAFGAFSDIIIGGMDNNPDIDNNGPEIKLWLNDKSFANGNTVGYRPILIAKVSDESGINTTGNGIGHDITYIIDGNTSDPVILNSDFQSAIDKYQEGTINKQLSTLEKGNHTLTLKAWDTHNNSSQSTINFTVSDMGNIAISDLNVYPNPMRNGEPTYFSFIHDDLNERLDIQLLLFNMAGQLISKQNSSVISLGNSIAPIEIKPTGYGNLLNPGLYVFKIVVNSQSGRKGEVSGKIMVTQ